MAKKRLFKSKTNFTLKRLHQSGNYGSIYERDYTTISKNGVTPEGHIPIYSSPSFKLSVRAGLNSTKKYNYGKWITNNSCNQTGTTWTLDCMPKSNSNDSKIILKPNKKRLTDFVCYGSSLELVRNSLKNIILNFPAELYFSEKQLSSDKLIDVEKNSDLHKSIDDGFFYFVENPFLIDILNKCRPDGIESSMYPHTRFMFESYNLYNIIKDNTSYEVKNWNVISKETTEQGLKECFKNGELIATVTFNEGDDNSELIVKCFYYEGELIYFSNKGNYHLRPNNNVIDNFFNNLSDFERILLDKNTNYTSVFETYIEDSEDGWYMKEEKYKWPLDNNEWNLDISSILYTNYKNSLEKMAIAYDTLFTDAIWRKMTHESISNMDLTSKINIDNFETIETDKIRKTFNLIGKQFDEIKKYIDNIKTSNSISYDGNSNLPDYFLSDDLSNKGWDVKEILNNVSEEIVTKPIYEFRTTGYRASDANNEFLRRLSLNSKSILKKKGTKQGIEELLSVFGYYSIDWINNNKELDEETKVKLYDKSYKMVEFLYLVNDYDYGVSEKKSSDFVNGVKSLNQKKDNFEGNYVTDDEFDEYDGLPFVEVTYGDSTMIVPWFDKNKSYDGGLYFQMKGGWGKNNGNDNEIGVYDYTISKIYYVNTKEELYHIPYNTLNEYFYYYVGSDDKYFKLNNIELHHLEDGWVEVDNEQDILQIKNIVDYNKGNNPHTGNYDDGISYIESFSNLFKNSSFENVRDEDIAKANLYRFDIRKNIDSTKCIYFGDIENIDRTNQLRGEVKITPKNLFDYNNNESNYFKEINSLSVINSKEFHIIFNNSDRSFIETDVIPYVKQMIPSTSIFSYSFNDDINNKVKSHNILCDNNTCPIYGVVE